MGNKMWQQGQYSSTSSSSIMVVPEILSVLLERERTLYSCRDYINATNFDAFKCSHHGNQCGVDDDDAFSRITAHNGTSIPSHSNGNDKINPSDRKKVVKWLYRIADEAFLARETVSFAMNVVDRYMSLPFVGRRNHILQESHSYLRQGDQDMYYNRYEYQLISLAALYIAVKLNERVTFSSQGFSAASNGMYTKEEIEEMERRILHALDWKLCFPTALQAGRLVLEMVKQWAMEMPRVHGPQALNFTTEVKSKGGIISQGTLDFLDEQLAFQTEIAVCDHYFATKCASTIAIGSILNAVEQLNDAEYDFLMTSLSCILREFDFEEPRLLLGTRDHLWRLLGENEEGDDGDFADSLTDVAMATKD